MPMKGETTPPPRIGKIGPYTVFVTPPATPKPSPELNSPNKTAPVPVHGRIAVGTPPVQSPPPVQAPPPQFDKEKSSSFGFLWDAVVKVQNAHESLDEHVAHWFGLNQSKYQWALDDYYETNGKWARCYCPFADVAAREHLATSAIDLLPPHQQMGIFILPPAHMI